ncbi:hypothetical protein EJ04DRAFT_272136 [Polyplosphaeria fusca]|uniref:Uncharacterized protein n=1 Tax=Polyplosphaeria fusca TaxID=682080 RepID=A0A9P4V1P9_9PLEO|nr:hypothetical protein EJ04DRAFT_272136 [Polyplosphaeria fusca]
MASRSPQHRFSAPTQPSPAHTTGESGPKPLKQHHPSPTLRTHGTTHNPQNLALPLLVPSFPFLPLLLLPSTNPPLVSHLAKPSPQRHNHMTLTSCTTYSHTPAPISPTRPAWWRNPAPRPTKTLM